MKVLGISTSPRIKGNSDLLLREALAGAESAGAQVEYVNLRSYNIGPCIECNACLTTGQCRVQDDYQAMLTIIRRCLRRYSTPTALFLRRRCSS
ncbi:MAG: flavodoxin family protein [Planctomycetota bacterium]